MLTRRLPPAEWAIRPARPDDSEALAALCSEHAAYEKIPCPGTGHAARLAAALNAARFQAWLGLLDGEPIGYASATFDFSTLSAQMFCHLDCLYLRPATRHLGLGKALLERVAACARDAGCSQLQWQTPIWNASAIRFYDRLGATRLEKQRYSLTLG